MPSLEYFLVCESVSVDQETRRVSLFNVVEEVRVLAFPANVPQMVVVTSWNLTANDLGQDFQVQVRFSSNGVELAAPFPMNFHGQSPRHRLIAHIVGMPITGPGDIRIELHLNNEYSASHTITAVAADGGVAAVAPTTAP